MVHDSPESAHLSNGDEKDLFDFNLENEFCLAFLYAKV